MPQDLYKWEDGGVLKHHCPVCQMPLSHDKCKTICLGNHVEWCHRYHTLFRMNWSSRCSACKTTDEQHEKRHREIAEILSKIRKLKVEEEAVALELVAAPTTIETLRTPLTVKAVNSVSDPLSTSHGPPKTTKKERKAAKKAAKALERERVVTTSDIELVAQIMHPSDEKSSEVAANEDTSGPGEEEAIRMNLKYNNSTCNTKSARRDFIVHDQEEGEEEIDELEIARILDCLDINSKAIGAEGDLVKELIMAVRKDLICFQDELRLFKKNRAGFWRWANKRAYRDLVENGKEWDAKNHWNHESSTEDRRDSDQSLQTYAEDEPSRNGSMNSSLTESTATTLTIPSSKSPSSAPRKAVVAAAAKNLKISTDDDGWTQVGKKVPTPTVGKLTLSSNGGLHHLTPMPKGMFGTLSVPETPSTPKSPRFAEGADQPGPRPVEEPVPNTHWQKFCPTE